MARERPPGMLRPMVDAYRSYVVRVRRRAIAADTVHVDVEDLMGGGRLAMHGDAARSLADRLQSLVLEGGPPSADTGAIGQPPQPIDAAPPDA
jgi:hypothetical protein